MTTYKDKDTGKLYQVHPDLGEKMYKGFWKKQGAVSWHSVRSLPWRERVDDAELDLRGYASRHKFEVVEL